MIRLSNVADEVLYLIELLEWEYKGKDVASTGSIYIDICRERDGKKEWLIIRVADHKQVYHHCWLPVISISPGNYWFEELEEILKRPFGSVGEVF